MSDETATPVKWRCYCPISLCRLLDPFGIKHALAYIEITYGRPGRMTG